MTYKASTNMTGSAVKQQDCQYIVISRYGDTEWLLPGGATNTTRKKINFTKLPECFQADAKAIFYRYILMGREGIGKPAISTIVYLYNGISHFLKWFWGVTCHYVTRPNAPALP
ncbi:hypothetical protein MCAMS1_00680 [biofilm metagenome]